MRSAGDPCSCAVDGTHSRVLRIVGGYYAEANLQLKVKLKRSAGLLAGVLMDSCVSEIVPAVAWDGD